MNSFNRFHTSNERLNHFRTWTFSTWTETIKSITQPPNINPSHAADIKKYGRKSSIKPMITIYFEKYNKLNLAQSKLKIAFVRALEEVHDRVGGSY